MGKTFRKARLYCRQTPRLWPSFRHYARPERLGVSTRAVVRLAIESSGIPLVPLLEDLLEILNSHHLLPVLWTLRL